ncbi:12108_t:CDS:2 [Ambispora leptoticha]|uniref:12108_t:CDS:1 n=1 Tax=Ambispora leptoticha TaxID=144679 RepID=A0A9N8W5P5_9GLOM|nr:12108_t:CDS:2 [Ambispora leptoticha]
MESSNSHSSNTPALDILQLLGVEDQESFMNINKDSPATSSKHHINNKDTTTGSTGSKDKNKDNNIITNDKTNQKDFPSLSFIQQQKLTNTTLTNSLSITPQTNIPAATEIITISDDDVEVISTSEHISKRNPHEVNKRAKLASSSEINGNQHLDGKKEKGRAEEPEIEAESTNKPENEIDANIYYGTLFFRMQFPEVTSDEMARRKSRVRKRFLHNLHLRKLPVRK